MAANPASSSVWGIEARLIATRTVHADFDAFYRSEYERIVRIAWSICGSRTTAEEIAQESFLAAHRRWGRVADLDSPGGWVRRVTINRALSVIRRRSVERRGWIRLVTEHREDMIPPESTAEVWRVMRTLPRRQIEALVLVVVEDRSVAEVAQILECGEETVRTHLRRGRLRMAELLSAEEGSG